MIPYLLCLVLFGIGVYGVARKRNIIKIIVSLIIAEYAVNLFFILTAYRDDAVAPILGPDGEAIPMADPLPHALVLTSIVIGLASTVLLVAIAMRLYEAYGTFDIEQIKELRG